MGDNRVRSDHAGPSNACSENIDISSNPATTANHNSPLKYNSLVHDWLAYVFVAVHIVRNINFIRRKDVIFKHHSQNGGQVIVVAQHAAIADLQATGVPSMGWQRSQAPR